MPIQKFCFFCEHIPKFFCLKGLLRTPLGLFGSKCWELRWKPLANVHLTTRSQPSSSFWPQTLLYSVNFFTLTNAFWSTLVNLLFVNLICSTYCLDIRFAPWLGPIQKARNGPNPHYRPNINVLIYSINNWLHVYETILTKYLDQHKLSKIKFKHYTTRLYHELARNVINNEGAPITLSSTVTKKTLAVTRWINSGSSNATMPITARAEGRISHSPEAHAWLVALTSTSQLIVE